jgi:hypothetical protein
VRVRIALVVLAAALAAPADALAVDHVWLSLKPPRPLAGARRQRRPRREHDHRDERQAAGSD